MSEFGRNCLLARHRGKCYCSACGRHLANVKDYMEHFEKYKCYGIYPLWKIKSILRKWKKMMGMVERREPND